MNRDFKGVWITKEIWLNKNLNALEKVILAEIDSLDCGEEGCYASNQYLAEFCDCSVTKVSEAISKLSELGLLEVIGFDGRTRRIRSNLSRFSEGRLTESVKQTYRKCKADLQKVDAININSNTRNIDRDKRFRKPTLEEVQKYIREQSYSVNAERFISYYESNGWKVGRNPMKDWKAAVRTWNSKEKPKDKRNAFNNFPQREYDFDDLEMQLFNQMQGKGEAT